jgi:hypothetical protein
MVRYLCGVFLLPDDCKTPTQLKKICGAIRRSLSERYARFPYWKELGTYLVLICGSELFQAMKNQMAEFKDNTGLHVNVMLGIVLVDKDECVCSSESSWGLYYSGKHFDAISASANHWSKTKRSEQASSSNGGIALV